jgi:hypothetical protein
MIDATSVNPRRVTLRLEPLLALLAVLAGACSPSVPAANLTGLSETLCRDDPTGSPGADVPVYAFSNPEYFDVHPGGVVTIRPVYEDTIAFTCDIGWGRSCLLGAKGQLSTCSLNPLAADATYCSPLVGVPKGSPCACKSVWGMIPGHAT